LKRLASIVKSPEYYHGQLKSDEVTDELERFSLWIGNIGALHPPGSSLSVETRLREAKEILSHIQELLYELGEVTDERKWGSCLLICLLMLQSTPNRIWRARGISYFDHRRWYQC
jgi:hypothetical protein